VLLKDFHSEIVKTSNFGTLEEFIIENRFPLLAEIGKKNSKLYIGSKIPMAYCFIDTNNVEQMISFEKILEPAARETRGKINFIFIDIGRYGSQATNVQLSGTKFPAFVIEDMMLGYHYPHDESKEITAESVSELCRGFISKTIQPKIKTEPVPDTNTGPVKVVVASTFNEIVLDTSKDVFVEIYAPWCGHCKALAPTWIDLGIAYAGSDVVIAKMDATVNHVEKKYGAGGYPTLMFFKKNDKDHPVLCPGKDRSLEALKNFTEEHRTKNPDPVPVAAEKKKDEAKSKKVEAKDEKKKESDHSKPKIGEQKMKEMEEKMKLRKEKAQEKKKPRHESERHDQKKHPLTEDQIKAKKRT